MLSHKIFGVGWKKTGTVSLGNFLDRLKLGPRLKPQGIRASAWDRTELLRLAETSQVFEDEPWCCHVEAAKVVSEAYPTSRFILTKREGNQWFESVRRWTEEVKPWIFPNYAILLGQDPGGERLDPDAAIQHYETHNEEIRKLLRSSKVRLLELNLEEESDPIETSRKVCSFLDIDPDSEEVCREPFPHKNGGTEKAKKKAKKADLGRPSLLARGDDDSALSFPSSWCSGNQTLCSELFEQDPFTFDGSDEEDEEDEEQGEEREEETVDPQQD